MPDWLEASLTAGEPLPPLSVMAIRTLLAMVFGFVVAAVHRLTLGRRDDAQTLPTTLVLLCLLIAIVTLVIGNSVARAFGLVGALSIVRFRTVVEDTRDTAFVIFAVALGMAAGAGYAMLAVIAVPTVGSAAAIMCWLDRRRLGLAATLTVRIGLGHEPDPLFATPFANHLLNSRLIGTITARQGSALELTYAVMLRPTGSLFQLVAELNRVAGVENVELRQK